MINKRFLKALIFTFLTFINTPYSQLISTWEMFKRHEIYYRLDNDSVTVSIDTIIINQPQNTFYKYTKDSIYVYNLDYKESKLRNCYMLRADRYKMVNDTTFYSNNTPKFINSYTFHFYGDTMVQTESWLVNFEYHQTDIFYFVKRGEIVLPPAWWPEFECHSKNTMEMLKSPD